jgi:surfeit locus 1 family protein
LATLKIRRGTARGEFDFSRQVALKHQNWMGSPGVHLITPFIIEGGSRAVLVDRGWIPQAEALPDRWSQFDEAGPVTVLGFIQLSQSLPQGRIGADQAGERVDDSGRIAQTEWYRVDIAAIQDQLPYELLPVYIQQSPPDGSNGSLPYRTEPEFDLTDGPHMGYAIQWYIFALILGIGYVRYVIKKVTKVTEESA